MRFTEVERISVCEIAHAGAETKCCLIHEAHASIVRLLGPDSVEVAAAIPHWLVASLTAA